MHIIYGNEKHLKQQPIVYRKAPFNGFMLLRVGDNTFKGCYFENGYLLEELPNTFEFLNTQCMTLEHDLDFDDLGNAYLNGDLFYGTSVVEEQNSLYELTTYAKDALPLNIVFDSDGAIEFYEQETANSKPGLEAKIANSKLLSMKISTPKGTLSIRVDDSKISSINYSGKEVDIELFSLMELEISKRLPNVKPLDFNSLSENINLRNRACNQKIISKFNHKNIETLTLAATKLTFLEIKKIVSELQPKKLVFENRSFLESEKSAVIDFLKLQPNLIVHHDYERLA